MGYENNPAAGSSGEFWAMYKRMTQQIDGNDGGFYCKV